MKALPKAVAFTLITLALSLSSCTGPKKLKRIKIAVPPFLSSSLIFIAKDMDYFREEGINAKLIIFPYGKDCLEAMLTHKSDLSAVFVSPLATSLADDKKIAILTELHNSGNNTRLLYRKDLLKMDTVGLTGIKFGLVKGTNADFLLSLFLAVNSIDPESNTIVDQDVELLEKNLLAGELHGAIFWQPTVGRLLHEYPNKLAALDTPFYTDFSALVGNSDFVNKNDKDIYKVIKALVRAKQFLDANPIKAHQVVAKHLIDKSIFENTEIIKDFTIELGMSQMFKVMLNSEMNWNKRLFLKEKFAFENDPTFRTEFIKAYLPEKVTLQ